jgi:arginyl-tRNA synthetase
MNLFDDIRTAVIDALGAMTRDGALPEGLSLDNVAVEPPRDAAHGDMATNAAMVLAKPAGQKPRDIAEVLAGHLAADPRIASAEVAGPGFLNLRLPRRPGGTSSSRRWPRGDEFGRSTLGRGAR